MAVEAVQQSVGAKIETASKPVAARINRRQQRTKGYDHDACRPHRQHAHHIGAGSIIRDSGRRRCLAVLDHPGDHWPSRGRKNRDSFFAMSVRASSMSGI